MQTPDWVKTAKVGDRVECVDGRLNHGKAGFVGEIVEGQVYEIRKIGVEDRGVKPAVAIWLAGVRRDLEYWDGTTNDFGFRADRFRPVQPRATDISVFTRLLNTAPSEMEVA